jgi:hypothetical protein
MMKKLATGCVLALVIIIGLFVYAQRHEECQHGHLLKTFEPCGSVSPEM